MTFDMTFKADSLSAEKREEDVKLTKIMQDCIGHRLERFVSNPFPLNLPGLPGGTDSLRITRIGRLRLSFLGPREPCTTENRWKFTWLACAQKGDISVPIERYERRLIKIEIMLYLVRFHCLLKSFQFASRPLPFFAAG